MQLKDEFGDDLIDLDELMPGRFSGTTKGIIQFYRDLIEVCQRNVGRTTCYNTVINERFIEGLVVRLDELVIGQRFSFHELYNPSESKD